MMDGLYGKYKVSKADGTPIEGFAFILRITDVHARAAMCAYAESVRAENPALASDLLYEVGMYELSQIESEHW